MNTMLWLQENWIVGYTVATCFVILGYVLVSVLIIKYARRRGYGICISGLIPIWNIGTAVRVAVGVHKARKAERLAIERTKVEALEGTEEIEKGNS